ncbi:hypothetical protein HYS29_00775 [Candidatus Microgenomates bacterium]|nr:hypothetical protein [Candidatus Microgenomates bacterium]
MSRYGRKKDKKALFLREVGFGKQILSIHPNESKLVDLIPFSREVLFKLQYAHPVNRILQTMQAAMLWHHILATTRGNHVLDIIRNTEYLCAASDKEVLQLMRRRALMLQTPPALSFFGIVPRDLVVVRKMTEELREKLLFVDDTYYEKKIGEDSQAPFVRGQQALHATTTGGFWVDFDPNCFWRELRPVLEILCGVDGRTTADEIQTFFSTHYKDGRPTTPIAEEDRAYMDVVFNGVLAGDYSFDYKLPRL